MARPPLPLGTWGTITTEKIRDGSFRALTRFREHDGNTRRVTATGSSKAAAERALRDVLAMRTAPAGELITIETRLIDLANLWITGLEAEGRIEQTTSNEYRRVLDNMVLPSVGGLKLREATTGRLDRLLLRLRAQSVNRQRKAKVVLGECSTSRSDTMRSRRTRPAVRAGFADRRRRPGRFGLRTWSRSALQCAGGSTQTAPDPRPQVTWPTSST